ncbi:MAG: DUF484 family protein [Candidimonas sp.]|nr:MAG: DUF484 family protein [Candidimonas sp.]TAM25293.1 MAG: DUF484 family protein [Candidimonas sp.]TAM75820.1 MAG: DUF484 family protein [Candidimonas sp.]
MSADSISAEDIAQFLKENPEFLQDNADLFASLRVPHPHEARAISLGERQIMTLRAKTKDLEWRLAGLIGNASGNEKIGKSLNTWCRKMLAEQDPTQLPAHIVRNLSDLFDLPSIALRLWDLPKLVDSEFTQDINDLVKEYARTLANPYCGPLQDQEVAGWLGSTPASLAIIALKPMGANAPFGVLVLGSDDPDRFTPDMGTSFLDTINELASASLSRLSDAN